MRSHVPHQSGMFVTTDEPIVTPYYSLKSIAYNRAHSCCSTFPDLFGERFSPFTEAMGCKTLALLFKLGAALEVRLARNCPSFEGGDQDSDRLRVIKL